MEDQNLRRHLLFSSAEMLDPGEYERPVGRVLSTYLVEKLRDRGVPARDFILEDWGGVIFIPHPDLSIWIGCGFSGQAAEGIHCWVEVRKRLRSLFKRVDTIKVVEPIEAVLEDIIRQSGVASEVHWDIWPDT
jgi:hypothetical protein